VRSLIVLCGKSSSKIPATLDGIAVLSRLRIAKGRPIWVVAAEREDAGRFIVHAGQELPAFLELESAIQTDRHNHECDCPEPDEEVGSNR